MGNFCSVVHLSDCSSVLSIIDFLIILFITHDMSCILVLLTLSFMNSRHKMTIFYHN